MEEVGCAEEGKNEVPKLVLFKELGAHAFAVVDLIGQEEGVVVIVNLNQ
mgnify:CR=1 FL=1